MKLSRKSIGRVAALAALAGGLAGVTATQASPRWVVEGTFTDGTALTGFFTLNGYGYLSSWNLTTITGPGAPAFDYTSHSTTRANTDTVVNFYTPDGAHELFLTFAHSLTGTASANPLVAASSFECDTSFACPAGPATRFIQGGAGVVPEPASWVMMLIGFGGIGAAGRRRRTAAAA